MNFSNFARAHDRYLEPPDDPEPCEQCGHATENKNGELVCPNRFCPSKFPDGSDAQDLAVMYLDAVDTIDDLMRKIKKLEKKK